MLCCVAGGASVLLDIDENLDGSGEVSRQQHLRVVRLQGSCQMRPIVRSASERAAVYFSQRAREAEDTPEGIVSESVESRLLHSASGFSPPVSCGTMRAGCGANTADVTTALCAGKRTAAKKKRKKERFHDVILHQQ